MKELSAEELKEWKRIITDVLREFHDICHRNGFRYFACGGTAIGAVRHKGIIPWDDDIDVSMPRPDYDRFINYCMSHDLGDYEMAGPHITENYAVPFIKLCSKKTTLIEEEDTPCLIGAYIDIFPLDGTCDDIQEAVMLKKRYNRIWNKLEAISTRNSFPEYMALLKTPHEWGRFAIKTIGFFFRKPLRKYILRLLDNISRKYPFESSSNVIVYCGSYNEKEIMPKSFCEGTDISMPFENISINMPSGYDDYLTRIYGDYMQLPPVEKQVTHHFHAVVDLKKRLTKKEALSQLR
ncbi:MAG: LicD family protein [Prevotella sp.]|nr:LicD family protein [Prevotella sp.]MCI7268899.1 LicD family protein [Prevotella sp.]MDD6535954.1 LicD family protein [Prevotella sp.]MDD7508204.1 LicD family protein [Prevotella sp.]MDY3073890.1 LicD family protein [Prevotella sp.]